MIKYAEWAMSLSMPKGRCSIIFKYAEGALLHQPLEPQPGGGRVGFLSFTCIVELNVYV